MYIQIFVLVLTCYLIVINGVSIIKPLDKCDRSSFRSHISPEGAIGQTALFPWYGLLKVYLHDLDSVTVAVTGIVLIKDHYAIANADEVAKIPEKIFMESSEAMFLQRDNKLEYYSLRGYLVHPEYPAATSIALVDIHPGDHPFPILPVCQHRFQFNTSNELYILGFSDDNGPLEKFLNKMEYIDEDKCKDFYKVANLTEETVVPMSSKCASAKNLRTGCVWESGTALVSNVTGDWALVGFGVRGPGCAAPARFLPVAAYWGWLLAHASLPDKEEQRVFRKGFEEHRRVYGGAAYYNKLTDKRVNPLMHAAPVDFALRPTPGTRYVPLHEVLRGGPATDSSATEPTDGSKHEHLSHFYEKQLQKEDMFQIKRDDATTIKIVPVSGTSLGKWGDCNEKQLSLVYKDYINVTMEHSTGDVNTRGSIQYQISLFDLYFQNYTCVTIKAVTQKVEEAYLQFSVGIYDGGDIVSPWVPDKLLKHNPLVKPLDKTKKPYQNQNKYVIKQSVNDNTVNSMMLNVKVLFANQSWLEIRVFGPPDPTLQGIF